MEGDGDAEEVCGDAGGRGRGCVVVIGEVGGEKEVESYRWWNERVKMVRESTLRITHSAAYRRSTKEEIPFARTRRSRESNDIARTQKQE